jgi:hypothetical protein
MSLESPATDGSLPGHALYDSDIVCAADAVAILKRFRLQCSTEKGRLYLPPSVLLDSAVEQLLTKLSIEDAHRDCLMVVVASCDCTDQALLKSCTRVLRGLQRVRLSHAPLPVLLRLAACATALKRNACAGQSKQRHYEQCALPRSC